jgi:hypothetical protein
VIEKQKAPIMYPPICMQEGPTSKFGVGKDIMLDFALSKMNKKDDQNGHLSLRI